MINFEFFSIDFYCANDWKWRTFVINVSPCSNTWVSALTVARYLLLLIKNLLEVELEKNQSARAESSPIDARNLVMNIPEVEKDRSGPTLVGRILLRLSSIRVRAGPRMPLSLRTINFSSQSCHHRIHWVLDFEIRQHRRLLLFLGSCEHWVDISRWWCWAFTVDIFSVSLGVFIIWCR